MKKVIGLILSTFMLVACGSDTPDAKSGFAALNHKEAMLQSHQWYRNDQDIVVHVFPDRIRATFADGSESAVAIPEDQFMLSIAPWVTYTHPCTFHVPTGCTGELIEKEMKVRAVDLESGETILDQRVTTQHDGFIDFWVPSRRRLEFTFEYDDERLGQLSSTEVLSTYPDDRTCITTMQLVSTN